MNDSDNDQPGSGVGYKRPPAANQFKKGQSGNPKGRPKMEKSFLQLLRDELQTRVVVNQDGERRSFTMMQIGAKKIAHGFAKGEPKAVALYLALMRQFSDTSGGAEAAGSYDAAADHKLLQDFYARLPENSDDR